MKKISLLCSIAMMVTQPALAQSRPVQVAAATPKPAPVAPTPARAPQLPPPEAMIILIRSSLVALSQANLTNNYTVLSTLGSPGFRAANPPQKLAQTFASFRENRIDMNPVVFVTPQLSQQPIIANGKLRLVGYFPTQPMRVDYDLQFEPDGGMWKLFGLAVNLNRPAAAAAPARAVAPGAR